MRKVLIIGLLFLLACQEDKPIIITPVIHFEAESSLTTEKVFFQAELVSDSRIQEDNYLVRWDWEGDSIYDTPYSSTLRTQHRFYEPGSYTVILEVIDLAQKTIHAKLSIEIKQGFSEPIPEFSFSPETGNPRNIFEFDASQTTDAEEEKEHLTFSWDFNNDHQFEIIKKGDPLAEYKFPQRGDFLIRLMVTDSSGLSAEALKAVKITHIDTLIIPLITYTPRYPTDWDTIRFDASESYYFDRPYLPLHYSFKEQNGFWKEAGDSGIYHWARPLTGLSALTYRVFDPTGYYQQSEVQIQVTQGDRPPKASFLRSSRFGNIYSRFFFNAWRSSDLEDMPSELMAMWDFDGDGSWDTQYTHEKYAEWTYTQPGKYMVKLKVKDTKGGIDETEQDIHVSVYSNPTGYIYDERSDLYYGTVKIGEQWWMGQNLRYNPNSDSIHQKGLTWCYDQNPYACWATGKLYRASMVLSGWNESLPQNNICPDGWKIPSASEWRELIDVYGSGQSGKELFYGGKSDFNALYGGYAGFHVFGSQVDFIMDSIYKSAVFMTTDIVGQKIKVFQLKKDSSNVEERQMVLDGYYSIRCIKNDD